MIAAAWVCFVFCTGPDPAPVTVDTFCDNWIKATHGALPLSQTEVDAMRDETLRKIVGLKQIAEALDCTHRKTRP